MSAVTIARSGFQLTDDDMAAENSAGFHINMVTWAEMRHTRLGRAAGQRAPSITDVFGYVRDASEASANGAIDSRRSYDSAACCPYRMDTRAACESAWRT
ncbi:hypothetical protein MRX96_058634 [Rhipicephalus microplus]